MAYSLLVVPAVCFCLTAFAPAGPKAYIDRKESMLAFDLLNKIRQSPEQYYSELKLYWALPITNSRLVWNDTLATAAEHKALDMAKRGYYAHVDPDGYGMNDHINRSGYKLIPSFLADKAANNFESIAAGFRTGEDAIRGLILDKNVPRMGHRNHLLGIGKWNESLVDIGIGFARCDTGCKDKSYISVLIAKHAW